VRENERGRERTRATEEELDALTEQDTVRQMSGEKTLE